MVTVRAGAHIDAYNAIAINTVSVKPYKDAVLPLITGAASKAVISVYFSAEAALWLMRPG